jgi:hypothetical protein
MDCNGRLGRALWLHEMKKFDNPIIGGFLQTFYYQVLEYYNYESEEWSKYEPE